MRVVIAPDSFKGSLSAPQAAQAMAEGVRRVFPDAVIRLLPMADGGEGTLDAVLAATAGGRRSLTVTGAHGGPLRAEYGLLPDGAVMIEVAQVVGITLPGVGEVPVARRTTRGLGELLRHCLERGARRFWVGLGGSATNDAGVGLLAALGARFFDARGAAVEPTLQGLMGFARADFSSLDPRLRECEIALLSDVDNPLCGTRGATAVFGPQKGVRLEEIAEFDGRLRRFAEAGDQWAGEAVSARPGSGAAGGLGYAFQLARGKHRFGAETVGDLMGLDAALAGADWAVTGEGRSDAQTLEGKAPFVVARRARRAGVPVTLVSGSIDSGALAGLAQWFSACFSLVSKDVSKEQAMEKGESLLAEVVAQAARGVR
jgi:glycerate kinase